MKPMKMKVDLKALKPAGAILILLCSVIALITFFTADLGVPPPYKSLHDTAYYTQSGETMRALHEELKANVFPNIKGIVGSELLPDGQIEIFITQEEYGRVTTALTRDFDATLFRFTLRG